MLMSEELFQMCCILYTCLNASWDWYTFHVKNIKSAEQNLLHTVSLAEGTRDVCNVGTMSWGHRVATPLLRAALWHGTC
jgi:hypothetical protein